MATTLGNINIVNVQEVMAFEPPALLIKNFCRKYEVSEPEARAQFEECKKFLIICAEKPDQTHAPSLIIDEMWHCFVLHTQEYAKFCSQHFGQFIHHSPSDGPAKSAYKRTLTALRLRFGELTPIYWPQGKAGDCSTESECGGDGGGGEGGCTGRCTGD
ncbi:MAG: hypothetical protein Q8Q05_02030 [bacterium]|nr:hypothetical protein [bacterium]